MPTIRLSWNDLNSGSINETGFNIYRDTSAIDPDALPAVFASVAADVTTYDDTTVVDDVTYHYAVEAVGAGVAAITTSVQITVGTGTGADAIYNVTVPSGKVSGDLTDFPLMIDLADMPESFWTNAQTDGGNVRAFAADGVTMIPHDVTFFDSAFKRGRMFVKKTLLSASANTVKVSTITGPVTKLLDADPNGRNAVWSDFRVVYQFPEEVNRTGEALTQSFADMEFPSVWKKSAFQRLSGSPHQGVTTDGTNFWSMDTNAIRRMDMSFSVLNSDTNVAATVLAGGSIDIDHLGDPVVVGNRLFTTGTYARAGGGNGHRYLIEFNATTLAYVTHTEIGDEVTTNHLFGATVCYDGTNLILFSYTDGTKFRKYTLDGVFVSEIALSADQDTGCQGSTVLPDGNILLSFDDDGTYDDDIIEIKADGTVIGKVYSDTHGAINEGLAYDETTDTLYLLLGDGDMVTLDRRQYPDWGGIRYNRATTTIPGPHVDTWTAASSVMWMVTSGDEQQAFLDVQPDSGADGTGFLYDDGPDVLGFWNPDDSWLHSSKNPTGYEEFRFSYGHDGTSTRKMQVNGAFTYDSGPVASMPSGGSNTNFIIGSAVGEHLFQNVWFREEYMTDAWMAADNANMRSPATFYNAITEDV